VGGVRGGVGLVMLGWVFVLGWLGGWNGVWGVSPSHEIEPVVFFKFGRGKRNVCKGRES